MKLNAEEVRDFFDVIEIFRSQTITVHESLTCAKEYGHNRHFTTETYFSFLVERIDVAISGAQLIFSGQQCRYGIGMDNVVSFEKSESEFEIVEQFEQETERRTTIRVVNE